MTPKQLRVAKWAISTYSSALRVMPTQAPDKFAILERMYDEHMRREAAKGQNVDISA